MLRSTPTVSTRHASAIVVKVTSPPTSSVPSIRHPTSTIATIAVAIESPFTTMAAASRYPTGRRRWTRTAVAAASGTIRPRSSTWTTSVV
jgi:hypothetical protein